MEPISNSVRSSTGRRVSFEATPYQKKRRPAGVTTPTATPGAPLRSMKPRTAASIPTRSSAG
jgi:hypothetical protein